MRNQTKRKLMGLVLVLALAAGCSAGPADARENSTSESELIQEEQMQTEFQPPSPASSSEADESAEDILVSYENPIQEAIYTFPWMGGEEKEFASRTDGETPPFYYIEFADLNLDGKTEILLHRIPDWRYGGYYEVYGIQANRLVSIGAFDVTQNDFENSQDSWGGSAKTYYRKGNGERVILQHLVYPDSGHIEQSILMEVSLEDFTSTPIVMRANPDSHYRAYGSVEHCFYYDAANSSYDLRRGVNMNVRSEDWDTLAQNGILEITGSEYTRRRDEYLDSLHDRYGEGAGYISLCKVLRYPSYFPLHFSPSQDENGYQRLEALAELDGKSEADINRAIAEVVYSRYMEHTGEEGGGTNPNE